MTIDQRQLGNPGTPAFQVEKYPFYLLNRTASRYNALIDGKLRAIDLDLPGWRVLMILGECSPRSVGQIAETAVINLSTMMRIVQRMTQAGLVSCAPKPDDNRVTEVFLTKSGQKKLAAARKITAPVYTNLIDGFSAADFGTLIELLDRLYRNLSKPEKG